MAHPHGRTSSASSVVLAGVAITVGFREGKTQPKHSYYRALPKELFVILP